MKDSERFTVFSHYDFLDTVNIGTANLLLTWNFFGPFFPYIFFLPIRLDLSPVHCCLMNAALRFLSKDKIILTFIHFCAQSSLSGLCLCWTTYLNTYPGVMCFATYGATECVTPFKYACMNRLSLKVPCATKHGSYPFNWRNVLHSLYSSLVS
ncbi:uncharacterized protein BYT42DRAFT_127059 [Radiomyces spectabilis]|uniref:uncharacterized protein n=1 Tax=Radiomyces spectabilis TaxID=64574 RepID=UPI00222090BD|nr:uncharacterized protein BYT42DRAFT_127059 [Radiomyces spectabilis]KAI8367456.1 hypothetical protein BYT42DRAFT_127059 [Radiomyces spectabilis]